MRDLYRPARPVARLLVVALGLLGFVAGPAGAGTYAGTHGGTSSPTGSISGVRSGAAQNAPARTRSSTKHRPGTRPQAQHVQAASAALLSYTAQPASTGQPHAAQPSVASPPASGAEPRVPSWRVLRAVPGRAVTDLAPRGVPRGRAPPTSPRI
ncbi:MAG: hypothetical protein ACRDNL_27080 [Spirillospora sp.]